MATYSGKLLNIDNNAKTVKGQKKGFLTAVLYLAPHKLSGNNVCSMASQGCIATCLNTAGMGIFNNVQLARIGKTKWFFADRPAFMAQLVRELEAFVARAKKEGLTPCVRLNGTSDILWERVRSWVKIGNGFFGPTLMEMFPQVQFYDYTKHSPHKRADLPANYALTFSLDERPESTARALMALSVDWNVAVVFRTAQLPDSFAFKCSPTEYPVVNGDENDLRFQDKRGVIVGLKAKGKARYDKSGFVRDVAA